MGVRNRIIFCVVIFFTGVLFVVGYDPTRSFGTTAFKYCNSKFVTNCTLVSFKKKIGGIERCFANISITTLVTINNNITIATVYVSQRGNRYKLEHKFCDYARHPWVHAYLNTYQKYNRIACPFTPGILTLTNMETPPQNLPVPLQPGEYRQLVEVFQTKTKERVLGMENVVNIGRKKKAAKRKKPLAYSP